MGFTSSRSSYFYPRSTHCFIKFIIAFLSTLPVGGATCAPGYVLFKKTFISIHAPRGGSDFDSKEMASFIDDFYPRSPWGERHQGYRDGLAQGRKFLSTLPVGGATGWRCKNSLSVWHFYPRSPWGERPGRMKHTMSFAKFLSTLPVGGATANMIIFHSYLQQFIMQSDNFF